MLAKETKEVFDDDEWVFEIKWDGYRAIAEIEDGHAKFYSRNGITFENSYPLVVRELKKIKKNCVLDGEVVVLNDEGNPEFQLLQHYEENTHRPIQFYVFDLLILDKHDICSLSLLERKELLKKIIKKNQVIKYSDHIIGAGKSFFEATREKRLEGIMAKKCDSRYYKGTRTSEWLKIKHNQTQEVIIAGYTEPGGARKYFGALVLGVKDNGKLKYVGHTGSGFNYQSLVEMYKRLQPLVQKDSPFDEKVKTNMPVTWVKPQLVCEVKFTEITRDGKLRHPIFLHVREDKSINEVNMADTKPIKKSDVNKKTEDADDKSKIYSFGKIKVKTSNPNKIYFPEEGITKGDVINYYITMSDYILPYLKGRPQ